jgi:hypothetical protein
MSCTHVSGRDIHTQSQETCDYARLSEKGDKTGERGIYDADPRFMKTV